MQKAITTKHLVCHKIYKYEWTWNYNSLLYNWICISLITVSIFVNISYGINNQAYVICTYTYMYDIYPATMEITIWLSILKTIKVLINPSQKYYEDTMDMDMHIFCWKEKQTRTENSNTLGVEFKVFHFNFNHISWFLKTICKLQKLEKILTNEHKSKNHRVFL